MFDLISAFGEQSQQTGTSQYQLQFTVKNPYQNVMNVFRLFILDSLLLPWRTGQTYSSLIQVLHFPIWSFPEHFEFYFTNQIWSVNIGKLTTLVN